MKLDRNVNGDGRGKYALILLRKLAEFEGPGTFDGVSPNIAAAIDTLDKAGLIDWGIVGTESEFFVTKLKDKNAAPSLFAYAQRAAEDDPEWAAEVRRLAERAACSPWLKTPD